MITRWSIIVVEVAPSMSVKMQTPKGEAFGQELNSEISGGTIAMNFHAKEPSFTELAPHRLITNPIRFY